jgi:hypothetical protein
MHRVLIPLAGHGHASLIEVSASRRERDAGDAEPGVRRSIARLQDVNLYAEAHLAANAAQRALAGRRARRWNLLPAGAQPVSLQAEDLAPALGLSDADTSSAGLGLALAWAMGASRATVRLVCATGALKPTDDPACTRIAPVDDLDQKLAAFAQGMEVRRGAATGCVVPVFLPALTRGGQSVLDVHGPALGRLVQAGAAAGMRVEIHALETLDQALDTMGARLSAPHRLESAARAALALIVAAGIVWGVFAASPVRPEFAAMATTGQHRLETPARVRLDPVTRHAQALGACRGANGLPAYRFQDTLVFSVTVQDPLELSFLARSAAVMISQHEPPLVLSARALTDSQRGASMGASILFEPPARLAADAQTLHQYVDNRRLVILSRRILPIHAARLERALLDVYASHEPGARLAGYMARIDEWSARHADYPFMVAGPGLSCDGAQLEAQR